MENLKQLFSKAQINKTIKKLAAEIAEHAKTSNLGELVVVCVLKGAAVFTCDLIRELSNAAPNLNIKLDFIQASSYGSGAVSSGNVKIKKDIELDISGRQVLLVDDILDSGNTLNALIKHLKTFNPLEIKTCVLLDKAVRRWQEFNGFYADYTGMQIEDYFIIGYGLDFNEQYRCLDGIYIKL